MATTQQSISLYLEDLSETHTTSLLGTVWGCKRLAHMKHFNNSGRQSAGGRPQPHSPMIIMTMMPMIAPRISIIWQIQRQDMEIGSLFSLIITSMGYQTFQRIEITYWVFHTQLTSFINMCKENVIVKKISLKLNCMDPPPERMPAHYIFTPWLNWSPCHIIKWAKLCEMPFPQA